MKDYSQYGEGTFLRNHFNGRIGFLVDVGAKGRRVSNTYGLIEQGWTGIMFEPLPKHYEDLVRDLKDYNNVHIVNAAVSDFMGKGSLYLHPIPGHSSLVKKSANSIEVDVVMLSLILKEFGCPYNFDLLSVDTEGHDDVIIGQLLQQSQYRPSVIIYEKAADVDTKLLENADYEKIYETIGNYIYRYK